MFYGKCQVFIVLLGCLVGSASAASAADDCTKPRAAHCKPNDPPDSGHKPQKPPYGVPPRVLDHIVVGNDTLFYGMPCITRQNAVPNKEKPFGVDVNLDESELHQGFSVTGGSCDAQWQPSLFALFGGFSSVSKPITQSSNKVVNLKGWHCELKDNAKEGDPPAHQYPVVAHLTACRVSITKGALESNAVWTTPSDGRLVMVARSDNSADFSLDGWFNKPMPFSIQVCMTGESAQAPDGKDYSTAIYAWFPGGNQHRAEIGLGKCAQIQQPSAVIVQQASTEGVVFSGYYNLFPKTMFPAGEITIAPPVAFDPFAPGDAVIGPAMESTAHCKQLEGGPTHDYSDYCALGLKPGKETLGYRICVGSDYLDAKDGTTPFPYGYPAGYLELVLDEKLVADPTMEGGDYDYRWNPINPGGCRDIFKTEGDGDAYFMVGPNTNTIVPWNPALVTQINFTVSEIRAESRAASDQGK